MPLPMSTDMPTENLQQWPQTLATQCVVQGPAASATPTEMQGLRPRADLLSQKVHFSKSCRRSVCTLTLGECCLRVTSGPGGAQVTVALSHPQKKWGPLFLPEVLTPGGEFSSSVLLPPLRQGG